MKMLYKAKFGDHPLGEKLLIDIFGFSTQDCLIDDCVDALYSCDSYGGDCDECIDPNSSCSASQTAHPRHAMMV